jgi:hypothetical protein
MKSKITVDGKHYPDEGETFQDIVNSVLKKVDERHEGMNIRSFGVEFEPTSSGGYYSYHIEGKK